VKEGKEVIVNKPAVGSVLNHRGVSIVEVESEEKQILKCSGLDDREKRSNLFLVRFVR